MLASLLPLLLTAAPPATPLPRLDHVQAVGGKVLWGETRGGAYRSLDGGKTWRNVTPGSPEQVAFLSLEATGTREALVVALPQETANRGTGPVRVHRTVDGGQHWNSWKVPQDIRGVLMDSPTRGTALGSPGDGGLGHFAYTVLRTHDGGHHWTQVNASAPGYLNYPEQRGGQLPDMGRVNGVRFLDARTGLLSGSTQLDGRPYLYRTTDGGSDFREIGRTLPLTGAERGQLSGWWVPYARGREVRVWASFGTYQSGLLEREHLAAFSSHDGGRTWARVGTRGAAPGTTLEDMALPDGRHGLTWARPATNDGRPGRLHLTADGGRTWQAVSAPFRRAISVQLSFADARQGWALAWWDRKGSRTLWRTRDGGRSWESLWREEPR